MPERKVLEPINGYCAPILERLSDFWDQKALLNAKTGTLDALLSSQNTAGRRMLPVFDERGKRLYHRLLFKTRNECPDDITVSLGSGGTGFNVCNTEGTTTTNRFNEIIVNPDDLQNLQVGGAFYKFNLTYDFAEGEKICGESEAEEIADRMQEWMDNYAIKLNTILWTMLSGAYTQYAASADPCDVGVLGGYGRGSWLDINNTANAGAFNITAVDQVGAVFPYFVNDLKKLFMVNGMSETPIAVHGLGGLNDYATFVANGARAYCCNDSGVNPNELAGQLGFFNFLEGRPTANNSTGITQDDVLFWEPGVHQLIQPTDFKEPGQMINQYDHERRMIPHSSGLNFHMVRHLDKCDEKLQMNYTLYHKFKLYSKPTTVDQCPGGTNQTILANISRCTPVDCDGNAVTGFSPVGDPTTDLNPA